MTGTVMPLEAHAGALEVRVIDPLEGDAWDRLVRAHPEHSIFQRAAWARLLHDAYGHRPCCLQLLRGGAAVALVPLMEVASPLTGRRGVSMPFADFGGILWSEPAAGEPVAAALLELARRRRWKHLELRGGVAPAAEGAVARDWGGHLLDLARPPEALWSGLDPAVRRAVRKAEASGLAVSVGRAAGDVDAYYRLHARTRRRHGLPPQPPAFFRQLHRHLIEPGDGEVVLARFGGRAVAGAVFLHSGAAAVYKFGASDPRHWPLRPNHLVMWRAIGFLAGEAGCRSLHFGRTAPGDAGLARFKRSWGSVNEPLAYVRYMVGARRPGRGAPRATDDHPAVFGFLPVPVNRIIGRLIYPHLD